MPDLFHVDGAAKVRVFGRAPALDAVTPPAGTLTGRIAPDELVVVGAPGTGPALVEALESQVADQGAAAFVVDHTDGWTFFSLVGEGVEEVFARISHVKLPEPAAAPAFFMGRTCDLATKAFRRPGRIDLMCGTETAHHVRHRLEHASRGLGLASVEAPADDPIGVGTDAVPAR